MDSENNYWVSLDQWRKDPEFEALVKDEFVSSPFAPDDSESGWARREFLKLMGASLALTSFGCVRRPTEKIVPYVKRPEGFIPGVSNIYASALHQGTEVFGILVKTREGRPIKVEGNPDYPQNLGAMSARAHASILDLYDPERLSGPKKNLLNEKKSNRDTVSVTWDKLDEEVKKQIGKGSVGVLTSHKASPSTKNLISRFVNTMGAKSYSWSPVNYELEKKANEISFGTNALPQLKFDKAKYVLSIGCDFLGTYLSPTEFTKSFSKTRSPEGNFGKLVVFEGLMSLTGTNADERYQVRASQFNELVMALVLEVANLKGSSLISSSLKESLKQYKNTATKLGFNEGELKKIAGELIANGSRSLVVAGGLNSQTEDAVKLYTAVNLLNTMLGAVGTTVDFSRTYQSATATTSDLLKLKKDINSGAVKTLIIDSVNIAYSAPDMMDELKKLEMVIYTGDRNDETGRISDILAVGQHSLESWSDVEGLSGVYSIVQPTIEPLYDTRSFQQSLLAWSDSLKGSAPGAWYDYIKSFWKSNVLTNSSFESSWSNALKEGVVVTAAPNKASRSMRPGAADTLINKSQYALPSQFELSLYQKVSMGSGENANNAWLQELPDPVSRICWDNYLTISMKDAEGLKVREGQYVKVKRSTGRDSFAEVKVPVHIQPGQIPGVVGLALGYGQKHAGDIAKEVGVSASEMFGLSFGDEGLASGLTVSIEKTNQIMKLSSPQGHHSMEGRQIVVESTLKDFKHEASSGIHKHKIFSLWDTHKYNGHKWGMSVDLSSCTGCAACVIACQSENNVPTVGKKYVDQGRIMHWIRIDRYYVGKPEDPSVVFQPVMCMHCDNAPCETVCPVAATVHGDEGTNDMIYNRCVGTRYCANNCPYKVRRFNWFHYRENIKAPVEMAFNPEVTVRSRGVMEKCSFCIHRIKDKKLEAVREDREFKATDVTTACQQSCPTNAITFGDMNDETSEVSKAFKNGRTYQLLEELNNQPAVRYKTKVRNTDHLKGAKAHGSGHGKKSHGAKADHGKESHSKGGH